MVYLALGSIAGLIFVFCSYWVYHYVDIEHDISKSDDREEPLSRIMTAKAPSAQTPTIADALATGFSSDVLAASSRDANFFKPSSADFDDPRTEADLSNALRD